MFEMIKNVFDNVVEGIEYFFKKCWWLVGICIGLFMLHTKDRTSSSNTTISKNTIEHIKKEDERFNLHVEKEKTDIKNDLEKETKRQENFDTLIQNEMKKLEEDKKEILNSNIDPDLAAARLRAFASKDLSSSSRSEGSYD